MRILKINNVVADINERNLIALSKRIIDWQRLGSKSANYSNTVSLPFTVTNNEIFKHAKDLSADDSELRNWYDVTFIQNGNEIISYGKGKLISADKGYKFAFYWGNIDLKDAITRKTIRDLDMADLNHAWSLANIKEKDLIGGDLAYPIIEAAGIGNGADILNQGTVGDPIAGLRLMPFVRAGRIIEQIETDFDLKFEGDIYEGQEFWIPVQTNLRNPDSKVELGFFQRDRSGVGDSVHTIPMPSPAVTLELPLNFDNIISNEGDYYDAVQYAIDGTHFTNKSGETQTFYFSGSLAVDFRINPQPGVFNNEWLFNVIFEREIAGVWTQYATAQTTVIAAPIPFTQFTLNNYSLACELINNQKFRIRLQVTFEPFALTEPLVINHFNTPASTFKVLPEPMRINNIWNVRKNLPAIDCYEFLNNIAFLKGLIFSNEGANVFRFTRVADVITAEVQDLTDQYQNYEIEQYHVSLAQRNELLYSPDDTVSKDEGDSFFSIEDNTLKSDEVYFTSLFSASNEQFWKGSEMVARIPVVETGKTEWKTVNPRILTFRNYEENLYILVGAATAVVNDKYIGQFAGLRMDTVWANNYAQYHDILKEHKQIKAVMNLSTNDFLELDLLRPVYIKQLGVFIIDTVDKFVEGQLTELKLIKI